MRIAIAMSEEDNDDDVLTPFAYLQSAIACIVNVHGMVIICKGVDTFIIKKNAF